MRIPKNKTTKAAAAVAFLSTSNQLSFNSISSSLALFQKPNIVASRVVAFAQTSRLFLLGIKSLSTISPTTAMNAQTSTQTMETMDLNSDAKLSFFHYDSVGSTQDTAKLLLQQWMKENDDSIHSQTDSRNDKSHFFAVSATEQLNGRGTNGRQWIGAKGNTFVTIAIPMKSIPVPIQLLPLQIGTIIARQTSHMLASFKINNHPSADTTSNSPKINVKWPNDVLIDGNKIAGVLIESYMDHQNNIWLLVGIGVNVFYAPAVPLKGKHRGRQATCLKDVIMKYKNTYDDNGNHVCTDINHENADIDNVDHENDHVLIYIKKAQLIASNLAQDLATWVTNTPTNNTRDNNVIKDWKEWAEFGQELILRDEPGDEKVWTVDIQNDGQLRVKDKHGKERLLVADYLL